MEPRARTSERASERERERKKKEERAISVAYHYATYVDQFAVVTLLQVVQHRRLVQVGQVGHVLGLLEFRRIHLGQLVLAELFRLRGQQFSVFFFTLFLPFSFFPFFSPSLPPPVYFQSQFRIFRALFLSRSTISRRG